MFRSRQLELREEAWGGGIKKSSTPFQLKGKSSLRTRYSNGFSTHAAEQKSSNYWTHLSGELIVPHHPPRVWSLSWARLGSRLEADAHDGCSKSWPCDRWAQRANNTVTKVLCQVEYWFHVLCSLDTGSPPPPPPPYVLDWKKFNSFFMCAFYCC